MLSSVKLRKFIVLTANKSKPLNTALEIKLATLVLSRIFGDKSGTISPEEIILVDESERITNDNVTAIINWYDDTFEVTYTVYDIPGIYNMFFHRYGKNAFEKVYVVSKDAIYPIIAIAKDPLDTKTYVLFPNGGVKVIDLVLKLNYQVNNKTGYPIDELTLDVVAGRYIRNRVTRLTTEETQW